MPLNPGHPQKQNFLEDQVKTQANSRGWAGGERLLELKWATVNFKFHIGNNWGWVVILIWTHLRRGTSSHRGGVSSGALGYF